MRLIDYVRTAWATMLIPPWRRSTDADAFDLAMARAQHFYTGTGDLAIHHPAMMANGVRWIVWLILWVWFLAALFLGAVVSPALIRLFGLTSYQHPASIGLALVTGVVVHISGLLPLFLADWMASSIHNPLSFRRLLVLMPVGLLLLCWPIAAVGYALFSYLTWIGPGQRLITVAFLWSLLLTTVVTFLKGAVIPFGAKRLLVWVRGAKEVSAAATSKRHTKVSIHRAAEKEPKAQHPSAD